MNKTMVKRTLALVVSAIATSTAFVGCTDYSEFSESEISRDLYQKQFDEEFIRNFGEPAKGHNWGMTLLDPINFNVGLATRADATENNVNVNRNQWCERDNNGYKDADYVLANNIKIPGWPNFDGYYYGNNGSSTFGGVYKHDYIFGNNQGYQIQPCGDVTEYEINYVSTWFRTHKNPVSEPLHLTDFFIQNISQDNDQLVYEHAIDLDGKRMEQGLPGYPKENQTGTDGNSRSKWWNGDNARYANDVIVAGTETTRQQGIGDDIKVSKKSGHGNSNENLNYSVDYLHFKSMDGNDYYQGFTPNEGWTHINNFNRGNSNFDPENVVDKGFREIKYVHSSGTEDFACRSSMADRNSWIHDWVLVHLEWEEEGIKRDGYYLAFDFSNETGDTRIEADGFYSNWIVKITPAYFAKSSNAARVMSEDLGGGFDFDYNDIVFDVAHDESKHEAVICLMAAGGTLPIVAGNNTKYEAHYMLGQSSTEVPVNVDAPNGAKHEVAIYRIPDEGLLTDNKLDISKIPVIVKYKGESGWSDPDDEAEIGKEAWTEQQYGTPSKKAPEGKQTPRRFATAIGVNWMKELQFINDGYQKFIEWVKNPNYSYEDLDVSNSQGQGTGATVTLYWYDDTSNDNKIYDGPKDPVINSSDPSVNPVKWESLKTYKLSSDVTFTLKDKAVDYITIASYPETDPNAIITKLKKKSDNEPVTFAYITKAPKSIGKEGVHGMVFPIWIIGGKPYYVRPDGNKIEITQTSISKLDNYRTAVWQSNFVRSGVNGTELPAEGSNLGQGVDKDGNYTFVSKYGYTKADLYVDVDNNGTRKYCDYIAFYVYENIDSNPYSTAAWTDAQGTVGNAGDVKKYEVYVIF